MPLDPAASRFRWPRVAAAFLLALLAVAGPRPLPANMGGIHPIFLMEPVANSLLDPSQGKDLAISGFLPGDLFDFAIDGAVGPPKLSPDARTTLAARLEAMADAGDPRAHFWLGYRAYMDAWRLDLINTSLLDQKASATLADLAGPAGRAAAHFEQAAGNLPAARFGLFCLNLFLKRHVEATQWGRLWAEGRDQPRVFKMEPFQFVRAAQEGWYKDPYTPEEIAEGKRRAAAWRQAHQEPPPPDIATPTGAFAIELVTLPNGLRMGKYEVTQSQYLAIMGENPSRHKGPNHPVERLTLKDAQEFCRKAADRTTIPFRLPTRNEWLYACKAGTTTGFPWGDAVRRPDGTEDWAATASAADPYVWFQANSGGQTHEVGTRRPNPWGLHDMEGNVYEWFSDTLEPGLTGSTVNGNLRGGSYRCEVKHCTWQGCLSFQIPLGAEGEPDRGFRVCVGEGPLDDR